MKRLALGVVAIASFALLGACGGNEGAPGGAKARYIEQGDAICAETNSQLAEVGTGRDTATLEKMRDIMASSYERLNALEIPPESQEDAQLFIAEVHNAALSSEAAVQASMLDDKAKVDKALSDFEAARDRAAVVADDYGFKVCSQS